jgi:hypothetical protein
MLKLHKNTQFEAGQIKANKDVLRIPDRVWMAEDDELLFDHIRRLAVECWGPPHFRMGYNAVCNAWIRDIKASS